MQRAKQAVEERYSVVGLLERRNLSLAVMEAFLPRWFRGLTQLPDRTSNTNQHPAPAGPARRELRRRLALDYDFYAFVEKRLLVQADRLDIRY
jgi:dermatan/chondrotin sulfate uronyl 2-O-sulfotransferase UST